MNGLGFSEPMMLAWLAGRKDVTRRLINRQPGENAYPHHTEDDGRIAFANPCSFHKPRYTPGEVVYVKETWHLCGADEPDGSPHTEVIYKADSAICSFCGKPVKWKSPRFMPEWASRSKAIIVSVRPERVQEITDEEIAKEGLDVNFHEGGIATARVDLKSKRRYSTARECFRSLWETLHPGSWEKNEWGFRYELEKAK
jgi:hypothetical protein